MKRYSPNFPTIGFKRIESNVLKYICAQIKAEFDRWFVINYPLKYGKIEKVKIVIALEARIETLAD